jgi:hypothetical protein
MGLILSWKSANSQDNNAKNIVIVPTGASNIAAKGESNVLAINCKANEAPPEVKEWQPPQWTEADEDASPHPEQGGATGNFTPEQILQYYNPHFKWKLPHGAPAHGWVSVRCPFHDDKTPSFGINLLHGGFKCHSAACAVSGDVYEFEMLISDVSFPVAKARVHSQMTIKTTYAYTDADGVDGHYVERTDIPGSPKKLVQYRIVDGKKMFSVQGVNLYPYHLPEVLKASTVFVVEGEKKCETVRQVLLNTGVTDVAVTTFCGGSNPDYS